MNTLLIDLDGVLYEGECPVPGAADAVAWIQDKEIPHLFLTNTTSRPRRSLVEKLSGMGVRTSEQNILTPAVAATRWLAEHADGPAALFVAAALEEFAAVDIAPVDQDTVAAVVIGDYAERWSFDELNRAFRLLMRDPHPALLALGMTRYWLADDGLRLDTAPFVTALAHASGAEAVVLGKPARTFFETGLAMLGAKPEQTVIVGDDIQVDIAGGQAAGITGALVRSGKFRHGDLEGDIHPEFLLDSIAQLPQRWQEMASA